MDVVGMLASGAEAHRPASGEADPAVTPLPKQRMTRILRRQLRHIILDGTHDRLPELADDRIDPAQQRAVGLRAAANRLVEELALRDVQSAQSVRESVEVR